MKNAIQDFSKFLAAETDSTPDDTEVIAYSLQILATTVLGYLLIIAVALLFGVLKYALTAAIVVTLLRIFSGGAHASSPWHCISFGGLIFPFIGLMSRWADQFMPANGELIFTLLVVIAVWSFSLWSVLRYAPADTPGKPITAVAEKEKLRRMSLVVMALLLVAMLSSILHLFGNIEQGLIFAGTLGLLWQAFMLTPLGYRFIDIIDRTAGKLTSGRRM